MKFSAPDWFSKKICHCGHEQHEGVCGKALREQGACDCAEFKEMIWTPCGAVWFYGMDRRPKKVTDY